MSTGLSRISAGGHPQLFLLLDMVEGVHVDLWLQHGVDVDLTSPELDVQIDGVQKTNTHTLCGVSHTKCEYSINQG